MAYKIIVSTRAQKEIENAIDYYAIYNQALPKKFILSLENTYSILEINPFFKVRYNNIRSLKINKYPYSLYFIVNEESFTVRILSCFHNKRDPKKGP